MPGNLPALTPGLKYHRASGLLGRHFDHEVHPRDHERMVQKAELHVLATNSSSGIVLLPMAANLFEHLRVDFEPALLGQQVQWFAVVQIIVKLAVRSKTWE